MTPRADSRQTVVETAVKRRSLALPSHAPPHRLLLGTHPLHCRREEHLVDSGRQKGRVRTVMRFGDMGYRETVAEGMIEMWESVMIADPQADAD